MPLTKEEKAAYDRQRYLTRVRPVRFGQRRCLICMIALRNPNSGRFPQTFCSTCRANGSAKRLRNRQYYDENRHGILRAQKVKLRAKRNSPAI